MRTNRVAKSALAAGVAALLLTSVSTGAISAPATPAGSTAVQGATPDPIVEVGKRGGHRGHKYSGHRGHKFSGHKFKHHKFSGHHHGRRHGHHGHGDIWPYLAFGLAAGALGSGYYYCNPRYEYCYY